MFSDPSTPEFVISEDPMNPIFYSTCYVRERAVTFLPPPKGDALIKNSFTGAQNESSTFLEALDDRSRVHQWKFNGQCLKCASYDRNRRPGNIEVPSWHLVADGSCRDCDARVDVHAVTRCSASHTRKTFHLQLDGDQCTSPITSAEECFEAAREVERNLTRSALVKETGATDSLPAGCVVLPPVDEGGYSTAFFNTAQSTTKCGSNTNALAGQGSDGSFSVHTSTNVGANITLSGNKMVRMDIWGVNTGLWFGIGFEAYAMSDLPYAIVVQPGDGNKVTVTERRLKKHHKGKLLKSSVNVVSTESFFRGANPMIKVTLTRPLAGKTPDHYTFNVAKMGHLPVITALGSTATYQHHKLHARGTIQRPVTRPAHCVCVGPDTITVGGGAATRSTSTTAGVVGGGAAASTTAGVGADLTSIAEAVTATTAAESAIAEVSRAARAQLTVGLCILFGAFSSSGGG